MLTNALRLGVPLTCLGVFGVAAPGLADDADARAAQLGETQVEGGRSSVTATVFVTFAVQAP